MNEFYGKLQNRRELVALYLRSQDQDVSAHAGPIHQHRLLQRRHHSLLLRMGDRRNEQPHPERAHQKQERADQQHRQTAAQRDVK